jgi:hypothetical protein
VTLRLSIAFAATLAISACTPPPPPPPLAPEPAPAALASDDLCYLVQAEAAKTPGLEVDPDVVKYDPRPLMPPKGGYPRGVIRRDGKTRVKVSVVVDTTGKADMATFTVVETTHKWLGDNLKSLVPKWTFTPAMKNGCRVAGLWVFTATPGQRRAAK